MIVSIHLCWAIRQAMSPIGPDPRRAASHRLGHPRTRPPATRWAIHRQIDEAIVRWPLWYQDVGELRFRHPQVLGLAAGYLACTVSSSRTVRHRCLHLALVGSSHCVRASVHTSSTSTGDLEWHHNPIAWTNPADVPTDLEHNAHRLVSQHVTRAQEGTHGLVQVKIEPRCWCW